MIPAGIAAPVQPLAKTNPELEAVKQLIADILADDRGASAIEYGLIAGFVSVAAISLLSAMGFDVKALLAGVSTDLHDAASTLRR